VEVARAIEEAHGAAVRDALAFIEREALFTREGRNGARQVETHGLVATAFTHRDSRAGDPDLHTHVAVANKVQTRSGKWLSIYGTVLHEHVVAARSPRQRGCRARPSPSSPTTWPTSPTPALSARSGRARSS
jgi:conjugative relaxase-like TrwC/TraI family protein